MSTLIEVQVFIPLKVVIRVDEEMLKEKFDSEDDDKQQYSFLHDYQLSDWTKVR
jgi:hypothetical protein